MLGTLERLRSWARSPARRARRDPLELPPACSWDAMRQIYEEQAARGVPEAVKGLEYIAQDRWPRSGQPRQPAVPRPPSPEG